jgi:hypothetical protein
MHFKLSHGLAIMVDGDIAHGAPPRLVFPPTGDNFKCTQSLNKMFKM